MHSELKPCPFCGGAPEGKYGSRADINCTSCSAGVSVSLHPGIFTTYEGQRKAEEAKAIETWNRRALTAALSDKQAGEPVAPSAWLIEDGTDHAWFTVIPSKALEAKHKGCDVTPLYTRPPHREGEDSAVAIELRQAASDFLYLFIQESGEDRTLALDHVEYDDLVQAYERLSAALAATRSGSATGHSGGDHG